VPDRSADPDTPNWHVQARSLSNQFNCEPELLHRQKKGSFITYIRRLTRKGLPIEFPFFVLEKLPRSSREEMETVRERSRAHYAEPLKPQQNETETREEDETDEANQSESGDDGDGAKTKGKSTEKPKTDGKEDDDPTSAKDS